MFARSATQAVRHLRVAPLCSTFQPALHHMASCGQVALAFHRLASTTVVVPEMAESITEGTLSALHKEVGDYVELDELVATIETDKVDVEVKSSVTGTVAELLAAVEDTVEVGQDLVRIEEGAAPEGGVKKQEKKEETKEEKKEEAGAQADGQTDQG